jgi:multisubunit Na+/H+ antiporter MnhB subunit
MMRGCSRSRWFLPGICVILGAIVLVASWLGGHPGVGLYGLAVMTGFGLFILLAGRSETIRGLRGDGRDERFAQIDLRATAVAGLVLIFTVIGAWLTELAHGHSGSPYDWLGGIGGLAYVLAVAFFRWRGLRDRHPKLWAWMWCGSGYSGRRGSVRKR